MNIDSEHRSLPGDDMLPEYDFTGGVRGKHYRDYREGHTVQVHKADGTSEVHYFTLADGAVMLEPDIRAHFPDSEAVNRALRGLIARTPEKRGSVAESDSEYDASSE